mgnify:CR=1 FL=1
MAKFDDVIPGEGSAPSFDGSGNTTQTTPTYNPSGDNLTEYSVNVVAVTPGVVQANTGITIRWQLTENSEADAEQVLEEQTEEDYGGS